MTVVICAWCSQHRRPCAAVRAPHQNRWQDVAHDYVQVVAKAGVASHGICPACWPLVLEAWGLDRIPMKAA